MTDQYTKFLFRVMRPVIAGMIGLFLIQMPGKVVEPSGAQSTPIVRIHIPAA